MSRSSRRPCVNSRKFFARYQEQTLCYSLRRQRFGRRRPLHPQRCEEGSAGLVVRPDHVFRAFLPLVDGDLTGVRHDVVGLRCRACSIAAGPNSQCPQMSLQDLSRNILGQNVRWVVLTRYLDNLQLAVPDFILNPQELGRDAPQLAQALPLDDAQSC